MKYLLGSKKEFYNFINSISRKDKIGIITHTDLDGLASAVFLQKILESRNLKVKFVKFLNYNVGTIKKAVKRKKVNKLFFVDLNVDDFPEELEFVRKKSDVFVIDHHPLNKELEDKSNILKSESGDCCAHVVWDLGQGLFDTVKWKWLVCSAIIFDYCFNKKENFDFIRKFYPRTKKEHIWESVPGKIGAKIANALIYSNSNIRKVYDLVLKKNIKKLEKADRIIKKETEIWIKKFKEESEYFPEEKLFFYYANPKYGLASIISSIISQRDFTKYTIFFVSDSLSKKGFVKVSARNQSGKVNLNKVLKKCIKGFERANAGGHAKASAGSFPKKDLNEFKERLLKEL